MNLHGSRALVVGMEASGKAAVKFLRSQGAEVTASDLKPVDGMSVPFVLQSERPRNRRAAGKHIEIAASHMVGP